MVVVTKITILNSVCSSVSDGYKEMRIEAKESELKILSPLAIVK